MTKLVTLVFALALIATGARITGLWPDAGNVAAILFGVAMILLLLRMINEGDKPMR